MKKRNKNKNKQHSEENKSKVTLTLKQGKPLQKIIPNNFTTYQKLNPLFNSENFMIKKGKDYEPPYEPFNLFPPLPKKEEVEVKKRKN